MSSPKLREEAVLFAGTLYASPAVYKAAYSRLDEIFGPVMLETCPLDWNYSGYYREELGAPLFRNFIFFSSIIDTAVLPEVKVRFVELEEDFSEDGKRRINLDPGYLSLAKVVLSSRKNYSHRIHLGRSVFAELELIYEKNAFHSLPYTYYDYRSDSTVESFNRARGLLKNILANR